jgi:multidrug resistance efflux pump
VALKSLDKKIEVAKSDVIELRQHQQAAHEEASEAQRNADAAKVMAEQRAKQAEKMRALLREGAVSQVDTSRAEAYAASAQGGYEVAKKQFDDLLAAETQYGQQALETEGRIAQMERDRVAAKTKAEAASTPTTDLKPFVPQTINPSVESSSVRKPAFVAVKPAANVPAKVVVNKDAKTEADSKLKAAKEKIDAAEKRLLERRISAPRAGTILKVLVKPGDSITPGHVIVLIKYDAEPIKATG